MRIYLDVCCLNRPYDDQTQDRIRLEAQAIESVFGSFDRGQHEWATSVIVEDELALDRNPMMKNKEQTKTIGEIRREGFAALQERLGVGGMMRFLHLFDSGSGDYTEERYAWLEGETVDEIVERIRKREAESG